MPTPHEREQALFALAVAKPAAERMAFLDRECAGDVNLRQRLEALLAADEHSDPFLDGRTQTARPTVKMEFSDEPTDAAVGQAIGRYKLLEKVGEGGWGVVYVAEQVEPVRRRVALKVIKLGMDTKAVVARFEAERQALAMMDHPNIAKVLDAGTTESGRPYFVMELVRGIKITDYCDKHQLDTQARLHLFIAVCQAVQHAHQKGIIHRDLKPSNILVTLHDGVPVPKVIDFGIAKATEGRLTDATVYTQLHQFIGTPAYMSPEQAEMSGLDIDTRSDIYSLGVLLYELLTASTPFDAKELMASGIDAMRKTIREKEPVRPSTRLATLQDTELTTTAKSRAADSSKLIHLLKGDLDWIVMKCLEKDRTRRYETANGLAVDLKRHLDNEPVVARPPSTAYRIQKAWQRNRLLFAAGSAVAAALVVGIGVSTWQAAVAGRARNAEKEQRLAVQTERDKALAAQQAEKQARLRADAEKVEASHNLYVADMNLTQQAWEQTNLRRVRQLLDETAVYPERGFEWNYWQRQARLDITTLRGHDDGIHSVAFSPDGRRIVTGSWDHTAKLWDAASGKELLTLKGHASAIYPVAFSPDGQRIVTGSADKTAKVWDVFTGQELVTLKGHGSIVVGVAYSPDGQRIVTSSHDQTAKVWDASSGKELFTLTGQGLGFESATYSPDAQQIVTGGLDHTAQLWDAQTGKELLTLRGHGAMIWGVAFSPDGKRIVTGSDDQTTKVWDAHAGKELLTLRGHSAAIMSVAYSPDGRRIVTGSGDQTAKVWDASSGTELFTLKGHRSLVHSVAFSPDGQRIVTGSADQTAKLWEGSGDHYLRNLKGHSAMIWSVAFSPDGRRIVTGSGDQTAKVWSAASGKELLTLTGHVSYVVSVAFSPDGQRIATGSHDQTAKVWDAASGKELLTLNGHASSVFSVAFSPDGQRIVTGSGDKTAKVWDASSGKELFALTGHNAAIWSVAFSPDNERIVTGSDDQTAKLWDAASGKELFALTGHNAAIRAVAYFPNGQRIVTGSHDQTAEVWDAHTGKELLTLKGHNAAIWSVALASDNQRIVTAGDDQTVKVWDASSGKELVALKGYNAAVRSVAFSPDGERIIAGGRGRTAIVWEAATAQQAADWQREEKAAAERLPGLRPERERDLHAQDPGAIKQWLVLAPIPYESRSGKVALEQEQVPQEAYLRPRAGERIKVDKTALVWSAVQLSDYLIDFDQFLGVETEWSAAYLVCYINSEADQPELLVRVGSDDEAKIYMNGEQIYRYAENRPCLPDQDVVRGVALKAGLNVLVFKVVNEISKWQGSVRFTDAVGQPVKRIKITLDPDGKE